MIHGITTFHPCLTCNEGRQHTIFKKFDICVACGRRTSTERKAVRNKDFAILMSVLILITVLFLGLIHMGVITGALLEFLSPRVYAAELPPRSPDVDKWLESYCQVLMDFYLDYSCIQGYT